MLDYGLNDWRDIVRTGSRGRGKIKQTNDVMWLIIYKFATCWTFTERNLLQQEKPNMKAGN